MCYNVSVIWRCQTF